MKILNEFNFDIDLCLPKIKQQQYPVVIYLHGGSFTSGDMFLVKNKYHQQVVDNLLTKGVAIARINYPVMPEAKDAFPSNIITIKQSLEFLFQHASDLQLDRTKFGIWGTSAGGNLAMMAAYSETCDFTVDSAYTYSLNYCVNEYGPADFNAFWQNNDPLAYQYSPINYVKQNSVDTLVLHGTADVKVSYQQALLLQAKFKQVHNVHFELLTYPNEDHHLLTLKEDQQIKTALNISNFIIQHSF